MARRRTHFTRDARSPCRRAPSKFQPLKNLAANITRHAYGSKRSIRLRALGSVFTFHSSPFTLHPSPPACRVEARRAKADRRVGALTQVGATRCGVPEFPPGSDPTAPKSAPRTDARKRPKTWILNTKDAKITKITKKVRKPAKLTKATRAIASAIVPTSRESAEYEFRFRSRRRRHFGPISAKPHSRPPPSSRVPAPPACPLRELRFLM